ncbi:DUF2280 domain-containing protein [Acinetobacter radioresistens]|uniref:DUF2280 domain-containing protein n=1 Tax=Acinetobacter radioresistens TaxID=40216 RepID=UPI000619B528|nr:DUF2280 domain-containing protein [Acinetobacter radioresistens]MCK4088379.1 DUF2280 domain-containing protein [Acinetobacter radioresistens]HCK63488.1 DUF2280 domain-containing protein [Acinetobacter radioresistens]
MAALKEPVKIFIVQSLACRDTPQEVADAVKQEFGIEVDRRQCASYDPTKHAGKNLSKKFKDLFQETRQKFDEGLIDIPIASKQYRLKQYDRLLNKNKSAVMALKILKQAAQDCGDQFTNRQEITGKGGGPVETVQNHISKDSYLEAREQVLNEY